MSSSCLAGILMMFDQISHFEPTLKTSHPAASSGFSEVGVGIGARQHESNSGPVS